MRRYLVGSLILIAMAGCARFMVAEREPWRHDAEVTCLKSGAVREGAGVVRVSPIEGPGICGADFPLKVATIGEPAALGFAGEPPRPPGAIPGATEPRLPLARPAIGAPANYPPPTYSPPPTVAAVPPQRSDAPLPSAAPGPPLDLNAPLPGAFDDRARTSPVTPFPQSVPTLVPLGPSAPIYTGAVEVKPAATLACPLVAVLDQWITQYVQPAAQRWFRQPVVEIKQISSYSCRPMNNQRGAKISEHAFGNALDVAAFVLADGRTVKVKDGWRGAPEEQGFLRDVQGAACERFATVLAPGADAFHYDHIHVDLMRRANGRRICQPAAEDGEVVAARAMARNPLAASPPPRVPPAMRSAPGTAPYDPWRGATLRKDDALVTGSTGARRDATSRNLDDDDHDWVEDDGPRPTAR